MILTWRLSKEGVDSRCMAEFDRRATRLLAVSFAVLALYVGVESTRDLLEGAAPKASFVGMVLAGTSLIVMPILARAKRRLAPVLGSRAAASEANQTRLSRCCPPCSSSVSGSTPPWAGGGRTPPPAS